MKKLVLALAAAIMLAGCGDVADKTSNDSSQTETAATTVTEAETTAVTTVTTEPTTAEPTTTVSHYPEFSEDEVSPEELKALDKLSEKYGREFTPLTRYYVRTEYWGVKVPEFPPMSYTLEDSEGREFTAIIDKDTDIVEGDNYLYVLYEDRITEEIVSLCKELIPDGKVWVYGVGCLPFDTPADLSFEEYRQAIAENGMRVQAQIYVTEGIEVPDEIEKYSYSASEEINTESGYRFYCGCLLVDKSEFDKLDDVFTENPWIEYEEIC
ncbi:MAG: hypothetical protein IKH96_13740 [Ruminococcus sp.]|uniref:hypothetical protein n=1 Tax=Ruminococcus sp. TaxID=41978 RepID=UPI0025F19C6F|nr:hypothetical protein [Ruminococcus sp.]MBR6997056.1 hypothetical protein [Ruminococcus sp.]